MEENPYFVLKPRVVVNFIPCLVPIILFLWIPTLLMSYALLTSSTLRSIYDLVDFFALFFISCISFAGLIALYKDIKSREYIFFRDRIEFYKGFWTKERVIVRYERVTDLYMRKSAWQRIWGTGTIFIRTAQSGLKGRIEMKNIPQPDEACQRIGEIMRVG